MGFLEKLFKKEENSKENLTEHKTNSISKEISYEQKEKIKEELKAEIKRELKSEKESLGKSKTDSISNKEEKENFPYVRKMLLTGYEYKLYKIIKPLADKYNLHILSKVRLIDFIGVKRGLQGNEVFSFISKIKQKHIDFLICNPDNLYPLAGIELDDSTHQSIKAKEKDEFKNEVFKSAGIKLYRINNLNMDIETIIKEISELK